MHINVSKECSELFLHGHMYWCIPDVVASSLALHVMEDGCIAAPERDVSEGENGTKTGSFV